MDDLDKWVCIGQFGRVHGVQGFITVHSYTEDPDDILKYNHWYLLKKGSYQLAQISDSKLTHKHVLVRMRGYETRETAERLVNLKIYIERSLLPSLPDGQYYWHDLIGLKVIGNKKQIIGTVSEILETGANDVLVVSSDGQQCLIPYLPGQTILEVDFQANQMVVDWDDEYL